MNKTKVVKIRSFAFSLALCAVVPWQAASPSSVTLCGMSTCYQFDDTQSATLLFGTPTLIGDALRFLPPSYAAISLNGVGPDTVSATFLFDHIYPNIGGEIGSISLLEIGDYGISLGGSVGADLTLLATNNLGPGIDTGTANFNGAGDSGGFQEWQISTAVNPGMVFANSASDVSLAVTNTLTANTSDPGDFAFIQKKFVLTTSVVQVPEPSTVALLALGMFMVAWLDSRRRIRAVANQ